MGMFYVPLTIPSISMGSGLTKEQYAAFDNAEDAADNQEPVVLTEEERVAALRRAIFE